MKYFEEVKTLDEAKNLYRQLVKRLHPDKEGGSHSLFVEMQNEFEKITKVLKFRTGKEEDQNFNADKFYNTVRKFDGLEDIQINFIGSFIWLQDLKFGAMFRQKQTIKEIQIEGLNFARWASKKKSWYYSPQDYKQVGSKNKSIEQLKSTYNSATFKTKQSIKLTA